jgi:hypothetical protein
MTSRSGSTWLQWPSWSTEDTRMSTHDTTRQRYSHSAKARVEADYAGHQMTEQRMPLTIIDQYTHAHDHTRQQRSNESLREAPLTSVQHSLSNENMHEARQLRALSSALFDQQHMIPAQAHSSSNDSRASRHRTAVMSARATSAHHTSYVHPSNSSNTVSARATSAHRTNYTTGHSYSNDSGHNRVASAHSSTRQHPGNDAHAHIPPRTRASTTASAPQKRGVSASQDMPPRSYSEPPMLAQPARRHSAQDAHHPDSHSTRKSAVLEPLRPRTSLGMYGSSSDSARHVRTRGAGVKEDFSAARENVRMYSNGVRVKEDFSAVRENVRMHSNSAGLREDSAGSIRRGSGQSKLEQGRWSADAVMYGAVRSSPVSIDV